MNLLIPWSNASIVRCQLALALLWNAKSFSFVPSARGVRWCVSVRAPVTRGAQVFVNCG